MTYLIIFLILFVSLISWAWVKGIDHVKENHPDYNGKDFVNWDNDYDSDKDS